MTFKIKALTNMNGIQIMSSRAVEIEADSKQEALSIFAEYCKDGISEDGGIITDNETGKNFIIM